MLVTLGLIFLYAWTQTKIGGHDQGQGKDNGTGKKIVKGMPGSFNCLLQCILINAQRAHQGIVKNGTEGDIAAVRVISPDR